MGILSTVLGGGGGADLLSTGIGLIGGLMQRGAVKKAGTTLANQFGQNAKMITDTGDRESGNLLQQGERVAQDIEGAANTGGQQIADTSNANVTRVEGALAGLKPYMGVGQQGIDAVAKGFNDDDSGLAWLQKQGSKAIDAQASGKGLLGGNDFKALSENSMGAAQQYRTGWLNDQLKLIGVGQGAQNSNIAGEEGIADQTGQAARDVADLRYKGTVDSGDVRYGSTGDAAKVRIGATGDAVDQLTGGAQATAASQVGSASALANVLNKAGSTVSNIAGDGLSWLQKRKAPTLSAFSKPVIQPQLIPNMSA